MGTEQGDFSVQFHGPSELGRVSKCSQTSRHPSLCIPFKSRFFPIPASSSLLASSLTYHGNELVFLFYALKMPFLSLPLAFVSPNGVP